MANDFFKNGDKAYSENLNDGVLVGNAFDWTVDVDLPGDTGSTFPNTSNVVKAKVCDVSITPNSNLSIGSTIGNSSGSSQVYRLTVYPNFNRFGGFKFITLTADTGVTFYIANKGGTSPIANNLDYADLSSVPELKVLKEYDIVLSIPTGKSVSGLSFALQSSSASVSASLAQSNVTGLTSSLNGKVNTSDIVDNLSSTASGRPLSANQGKILNDTKASISHTHGWVENTLNTYAKLYVNEGIRMCELNYVRTFDGADADKFYVWHSGEIPSAYRPPDQVQGAFNQVGIIYVDSTGEIGGKFANAWTGERLCKGSVSWHY